MPPIRRLLVANRGEIARRIARSARATGASVVAVYAEGDAGAPHVNEADTAVALRGRGAAETYLDIDQLVAAARVTGADAVHPGYGFLSERPAFARAVLSAGLTWVGPPPEAIEAMGDKLAAKRLMAAAGVPVLPTLEVGDAVELATMAADVAGAGLAVPLIVKAAAGGGGKGMRIVENLADLPDAVAAAQREAKASFGDPTVFVEPYVRDARHVEIQILADDHGHVVHCFERDCSIQRRHQKVIEEAPSPSLDAAQRAAMGAAMGAAAVAAARAVGYRNAGTVEFVVRPDGSFWFLEVNTRLQVEHPVTEAVTGLDLVREQLQIAAGLSLSWTQEELRLDGHAIEARLYAEDPATGFLPAVGTIVEWAPAADPPVRWDSGVETATVVGVDWDPMLAKVIAHAPTRTEAALRLALALERARIRGVTTNRDFLVAALRHPEFLAGRATTGFVSRADVALSRAVEPDEVAVAAVAATLAGAADRRAATTVLRSLPSGWHTGVIPPPAATFTVDALAGAAVTVAYSLRRDGAHDVTVTGPAVTSSTGAGDPPAERAVPPPPAAGNPSPPAIARAHRSEGGWIDVEIGGRRTAAHVLSVGATTWVQTDRGDLVLHEVPRFPEPEIAKVAGGLVAPMPGKVLEVAVAPGASVAAGALLVIVEAMKMEHRVTAPYAGTVGDVLVAAGDQVTGGDLLVVVDPAGAPPA